MLSISFLSPTTALLFIGCCYAIHIAYWQLTTGASRRRLTKQAGCRQPKKLPAWDPIFALDNMVTNYQEYKRHRTLESTEKAFRDLNANTIEINLLGQKLILTTEPENIKAMLATNFERWSVGHERLHEYGPFLGEGIFTSDGAAWKRSRDMLRPNFVRSRVGDLEMFEHHVEHLIQAIPQDGSTVDLQGLFFRLSLDVATEFLFGESTNTLAPGISTASSAGFTRAFTYLQSPWEQTEKLGILGFFLPDPKFKRYCRVVHGKRILGTNLRSMRISPGLY